MQRDAPSFAAKRAPDSPSRTATRLVLLLFFVSGSTSLAYQLLWARELQLVFGTSTLAIATILATFMGGLALGGFAIARHADRLPRPLAVYGALEFGVGIYALVFPLLVAAVTPLYLDAWRVWQPGPVAFGLIQFVLVAVLLVLPTAAMGATLPVLVRFATRRLGAAGNRIGTLYSVNTFGAVTGVLLCGFLLLPRLGLSRTTLVAATANLLLGAVALGVQRRVAGSDRRLDADLRNAVVDTRLLIVVCTATALAGFAALVYELAWTRLLTLMLGGSAYTFPVMLIAFLVGIAAGAGPGGRLADRVLAAGGWRRLLLVFAAIESAIAIIACATMYLYPELPIAYVRLFDGFGVAERPRAAWLVSLVLAGLVMTPPAFLMGMHFPVAVRAVAGYRRTLGRPVGIVYGVNALGGAAGAFLAGFVLLPAIGVQGAVFVAATAGLAAAAVLAWFASHGTRRRLALLAPVGLAVLAILVVTRTPPWNPLLMTAGLYHYATSFDDHSRDGILQYSVGHYDLVYYEEGLSSVVTVADNAGTPHRWLAVDGKVDASTTEDMPTQVLLSLLPMQFVERPDDVLVIGLASGVSAGSAALFSEVRRLDIVELEPAVGRAARFFDDWNHGVLDDARVDVIYNDGRNHLLVSRPASYDVVVSEPSNPWISGVASLFTREFLATGKTRLKPGGVWSQWVPIYGMDRGDLQSILRTFADVFPHVLVYASIERNDLVLIGSDAPLHPGSRAARRLLQRPEVATELRRARVYSESDLLSLYLMDSDAIAAMDADVPLNTDDNLFIEFSTATKLRLDRRGDNYAMLLQYSRQR